MSSTVPNSTIGDVQESIEQKMFLAGLYEAQGATSLANEQLRGAWIEWLRYGDILRVYGDKQIGEQLTAMVTKHAPELLVVPGRITP